MVRPVLRRDIAPSGIEPRRARSNAAPQGRRMLPDPNGMQCRPTTGSTRGRGSEITLSDAGVMITFVSGVRGVGSGNGSSRGCADAYAGHRDRRKHPRRLRAAAGGARERLAERGADRRQVVEAITRAAVYCGLPKALNAIFVAKRVFAERGLLPVEAPAAA